MEIINTKFKGLFLIKKKLLKTAEGILEKYIFKKK